MLQLFNESRLLDSDDIARALEMSRTSAASALLRYWKWSYLARSPNHTGERGRPPFVYSRTPKGYLRYNQYKMQLERGWPLNLHRYKPIEISDLESCNLEQLVGEADRDEPQDESKD